MECQYKLEKILLLFIKKLNDILGGMRYLQKDSIKYRSPVWHYNGKYLCKIRNTYYPIKLSMAICVLIALAISRHMLCGQQTFLKCHRHIEFVNFAK